MNADIKRDGGNRGLRVPGPDGEPGTARSVKPRPLAIYPVYKQADIHIMAGIEK